MWRLLIDMELKEFSKEQLQKMSMDLGLGVDLLWNKEQLIWVLYQHKTLLESIIKYNQEELARFNKYFIDG